MMPSFTEDRWSATFDSYDQRNEDAYFLVSTGDLTFMVSVDMYASPANWDGPEFTEYLRSCLRELAEGGVTNTTYRGYNR